jgi:hypothetical protein
MHYDKKNTLPGVPNPEIRNFEPRSGDALRPHTRRSRLGEGAGRGRLSRQGGPGYNPRKFFKFSMQNPAFWCSLGYQY